GGFEVTKVMAGNETLEAVDGVYSFDVRGNVEVSISAKNPSVVGSIAKYDVSYSLGDRKTAKAFASKEEIMDSLVKVEGDNLITSCDEYELMYGGANGGSGETVWKLENVMKFGSTSANGNLTLSLGQEVNRVVLTGYVYASTCDVRIGDSSSSDWGDTGADNKTTKVRCSDMIIASKETVEAGEMSQITIDFESTRTLKIATTNKKPLFLASIEFVYHDGE
ncbi:MAG: hypothetical protein MJ239_07120, partial [Bacilli bacterium]|nr:hypothetical protein [Bacilli bacterium]